MNETATKPDSLLPCPFCGATDDQLVQAFTRATDRCAWWSVECLGCGCEIADDASQDAADTAWNTRTTPTPAIPATSTGSSGEVERLREALVELLEYSNPRTNPAYAKAKAALAASSTSGKEQAMSLGDGGMNNIRKALDDPKTRRLLRSVISDHTRVGDYPDTMGIAEKSYEIGRSASSTSGLTDGGGWHQASDLPPERTPVLAEYREWNNKKNPPSYHVVWWYGGSFRPYPQLVGEAYCDRWNADLAEALAQPDAVTSGMPGRKET